MKKLSLLILLCALVTGISYGQTIQNEVTASAGAHLSAGNLDMELTIGEPVTETLSSSGIITTQGFIQPGLIQTPIEDNRLEIMPEVFPNPTSESLIIGLPSASGEKYTYHLYNSLGKLLTTDILISGKNRLSMQNFASGTYLLTIENTESEKQNLYKIIKSK
ncbi:MAG: T9SS type A sorting domain-containing protein [Bacteroidota bacterium]